MTSKNEPAGTVPGTTMGRGPFKRGATLQDLYKPDPYRTGDGTDGMVEVSIRNGTDTRWDTPIPERLLATEHRPVTWLWKDRIPRGRVTLIQGPPGTGKSVFVHYLMSAASSGDPWPDDPPEAGPREPLNVLLVGNHECLEDTLNPRLSAMNGLAYNLTRWVTVEMTNPIGGAKTSRDVAFPEDIPQLEWMIREQGLQPVVIIDPITDHCRTARQLKDTIKIGRAHV